MNPMKIMVILLGLTALFWSCGRVDDPNQVLPADTTKTDFKPLSIRLDTTTGNAIVHLDSLVKTDKPFTIQFTPMRFGAMRIDAAKRLLLYVPNTTNWTKDSTTFDLCQSQNCRKGTIVVTNPKKKTVFYTCVDIPWLSPLMVSGQNATTQRTVLAAGGGAKITAINSRFYNVEVNPQDSLKITFSATGAVQYWAFDDVTYTVKKDNGECYNGGFSVNIGDTNAIQARKDYFTLDSNYHIFSTADLHLNDWGDGGSIRVEPERLSLGFDADNSRPHRIDTYNGSIRDTTIGNSIYFIYQRTNLRGLTDEFTYYHVAKFTLRISRAKVVIRY